MNYEVFRPIELSGSNPPFMSGVPELLVLQLLERRAMYGYELVRAIRTTTGDNISLGEGVIYPVLHGLERAGALKAESRLVNGRRRVYYRVMAKGRQRLHGLKERWVRISEGIDKVLDNTNAHPAGHSHA